MNRIRALEETSKRTWLGRVVSQYDTVTLTDSDAVAVSDCAINKWRLIISSSVNISSTRRRFSSSVPAAAITNSIFFNTHVTSELNHCRWDLPAHSSVTSGLTSAGGVLGPPIKHDDSLTQHDAGTVTSSVTSSSSAALRLDGEVTTLSERSCDWLESSSSSWSTGASDDSEVMCWSTDWQISSSTRTLVGALVLRLDDITPAHISNTHTHTRHFTVSLIHFGVLCFKNKSKRISKEAGA